MTKFEKLLTGPVHFLGLSSAALAVTKVVYT